MLRFLADDLARDLDTVLDVVMRALANRRSVKRTARAGLDAILTTQRDRLKRVEDDDPGPAEATESRWLGKVTVATGHGLNEEVKPGTLRSIERQAGWRP